MGKNQKMKKGTVKFFNTTKGFGFIKGEDGQEVFVHVTSLKEEMKQRSFVFPIREIDWRTGKLISEL